MENTAVRDAIGLQRKSLNPARGWGMRQSWLPGGQEGKGGFHLRVGRWKQNGRQAEIVRTLVYYAKNLGVIWDDEKPWKKVWCSDKICWCIGKHLAHRRLSINAHLKILSRDNFFPQESPCISLLYAYEKKKNHDERFNAVKRAPDQELGVSSGSPTPICLISGNSLNIFDMWSLN